LSHSCLNKKFKTNTNIAPRKRHEWREKNCGHEGKRSKKEENVKKTRINRRISLMKENKLVKEYR
jgi:hypothetical protein